MARPRKSGGKNTSFGKKSEAEKSFRDRRKRSGRGAEEESKRPRFKRSDEAGSRPFRSSSRFSGKPSFGRDEERREGGERPYRKKTFGSGSTGAEKDSRFGKKSYKKREEGEGKSFSNSRFEKKPYSRREPGNDKPFKKRSTGFRSDEERPRFGKAPFKKQEEREEKSFRSSRFEKKPFSKHETREDKPFKKRSAGFRSNEERPRIEKPFGSGEGKEKPSGKGGNYGLPYKRKTVVKKRGFTSIKRRQDEAKPADTGLIRLNKFMANSGVGSRREADELIKMGLVTVNGETITEMGHKIKPTDDVRYEGRKLKAEKAVYVLLNKPKGFITTTDDPQERNTVMNLVAAAGKERIYPVGRLDRNTTGLLLLTNDGDLADKLTHPSYNVKKIYRVELDKPITKNDFIKIKEGVYLEEGRAMVDDLAIVDGDNKTLGIELHIGWNRIVRRIFESLGYQVVKLDRVAYAGLDKKDLARGQWRFLKPEEVVMLKHFK